MDQLAKLSERAHKADIGVLKIGRKSPALACACLMLIRLVIPTADPVPIFTRIAMLSEETLPLYAGQRRWPQELAR